MREPTYHHPNKYGKVPFNRLQPGDVIFCHVGYRDNPAISKTRPVVVIEKLNGREVVACPLYSTAHGPSPLKVVRHQRTSFIDVRAIVVDRYNFVSYDEEPLDDDTWNELVDVIDWSDIP